MKKRLLFLLLVLAISIGLNIYFNYGYYEELIYGHRNKLEITKLNRTILTPFFDEEIKPDHNVVYCSAFQKSWDYLYNNGTGYTAEIAAQGDFAKKINMNLNRPSAVSDDYCVSLAGYVKDGIINKINENLEKKFKSYIPLKSDNKELLMFSYLEKEFTFDTPFEDLSTPVNFKYGEKASLIEAYGIQQCSLRYSSRHRILMNKFKVLYSNFGGIASPPGTSFYLPGLIIQLKLSSSDDEIIMADVPPEKNMKLTYEKIIRMIDAIHKNDGSDILDKKNIDDLIQNEKQYGQHFCCEKSCEKCKKIFERHYEVLSSLTTYHDYDNINFVLVMPKINLNILAPVLTSSKTTVYSGVNIKFNNLFRYYYTRYNMPEMGPIPINYYFNTPFFIFLKKKSENLPYLMAYIGNDELLKQHNSKSYNYYDHLRIYAPKKYNETYPDFIERIQKSEDTNDAK